MEEERKEIQPEGDVTYAEAMETLQQCGLSLLTREVLRREYSHLHVITPDTFKFMFLSLKRAQQAESQSYEAFLQLNRYGSIDYQVLKRARDFAQTDIPDSTLKDVIDHWGNGQQITYQQLFQAYYLVQDQ